MKKLSQLTDEELALKYVDGNNRAFDELLNRTQTGIFSYTFAISARNAISCMRCSAGSDSATIRQEAITKLQMHKYSPTGKFNAWLIRIAHNTIMDWYRRQKAQHIIDTDGDDLLIAQMSDKQLMETSREDLLANAQVMSDVRSLVDFLPESQREIVKMRYYQNLSFKEIAEQTGVSINTSLGRMRYALINMRRLARENNLQLQLA